MDIDAAFPSKYLKAADLNGERPRVTFEKVAMEDIGGKGDPKELLPVAYFVGCTKGFVLGHEKVEPVKAMYGKDTDGWIGRTVTLFETTTRSPSGGMVPCIRIEVGQPAAAQPAATPAPAQPVAFSQTTGQAASKTGFF